MTEKKRFRVFATSHVGDAAENRLRERGYDLEVFQGPEAPPKKLIIEKVKSGIDGLITTLRDPIDAEVFEAGKGTLKVVAQIAVGFDNVNRADANKYKIPFTNTADVLTEATAEFAFFMMGMLARKMWQSERLVREQKWPSWHPFLPFLGDEITGKTIAVIGTGRIGLAMIKKCSGFDMNILCYDPAYHNEQYIAGIQALMDLRHARGIQKEKTWIKYVELEEALRDADYVTIHVPLLREGETDKPTYHLINEKTLKLMKPTAYLVNSSRGPVVDEKALAKALKEKLIAGAALDVFEKEPLPPDSPLLDSEIADRCRVFHHFASGARITRLSVDPEKGMAGRTVQGLIDVLEGNLKITASATSSPSDFDFLIGKWKMHNRRLNKRLENCKDWTEFDSSDENWKILSGTADMDIYSTAEMPGQEGKHFEGLTLRLFNPKTRLWSLYWVASNSGVMDPPVVGSFENNVGHFFCKDTFNGKPIIVMFRWDARNKDRPIWSQAFSTDNGKTWEWNWYNVSERIP